MSRILASLALVGLVVALGTGCDKPVDDGKQIPTGTVGIDVEARKHPQASCTSCTDPVGGDVTCECVNDSECPECQKCSSTCGTCGPRTGACTDDGNDCTTDVCSGGACVHNNKSGGQACGDPSTTACTNPDTCGAGTGVCNPNHVANDTICNTNGPTSCNACFNGACTARSGAAPLFGCTDQSANDCFNAACVSGQCQQQPASSTYIKITGTLCNPQAIPSGNNPAVACYSCQSTTTTSTCTARTTTGPSAALACNADSDLCTDDFCDAGTCKHNVDTSNSCGTCKTCASGTCLDIAGPQQAPGCSSICEECVNGACQATPAGVLRAGCVADSVDCTNDWCVGGTSGPGACVHPNKDLNQPCGDPTTTACTNPDTCGDKDGICRPNHVANDTICNTNGPTSCNACSNGTCTARSGAAPLFGCTDQSANDCFNAACVAGQCQQQPASATYIKATDTPCNPQAIPSGNNPVVPCYSCQSTTTTSACTARTTPGPSAALGCNDDGALCTDDFCNAGTCTHQNDDTNTCGTCKTCSAGNCNNIVGPIQATGCSGVCQECVNGSCGAVPAQTLRAGCVADSNECTDDWCVGGATGAGACVHPAKSGGQACGSSADTECSNPDTCGAGTGLCNANDEANGFGCVDTKPNDCYAAACSSGTCSQVYNATSKNGAACTQAANGTDPVVPAQPPCSAADTCLAGVCQPNHAATNSQPTGCDTPCNACNSSGACTPRTGAAPLYGCSDVNPTDCFFAACITGSCTQQPTDSSYRKATNTTCNPDGTNPVVAATECSLADTCDANGVCQPNHLLPTESCGDDVCNNCDGNGVCTLSTSGVSGPGCSASAGDCSGADTCNASGSCDLNDFADGTPCKTGICEECSGGGCIKTPLGQQGPGCKTAADPPGGCSDADTCENGVCNANHKPSGTACTDATPGDCNVAECNGSGVCVQAHRVIADGLACGDGVCDQCSGGACIPTPGGQSGPGCDAAGTECSDAGSCDGAGACQGNPKPATTLCADTTPTDCKIAKCNGQGACDQAAGDVSDGIACDNGPCKECAAGVCVPTKAGVVGPGCTADSNACTFDYCSGVGTCVHPPKTGSSCNDGDDCTFADQCTNMSTCKGTSVVCVSDVCGTRSCNGTATCTLVAHDDVDCDADDDKCTPNDKCKDGICVKDQDVVCVQQDCYTTATCNKTTGECESTPLSDVACGLTGCFEAGTCTNGVCSGTAVDCSFLDDGCLKGVCDTNAEGSGQDKCRQDKRPNGSSCDGSNLCLIDAVCVRGICEGDIKPCTTTATCRVAACEPTTGECVDQLATPGTACALSNDCLENTSCNASGECRGTLLPDDAPCGTAADCPGAGVCSSGACICNTEAVDLAVSQDLTQGGTTTPPDLTPPGPSSPTKCGCQAGPAAIPESVLFFLIVGLGLRRRRQ